MKPSIPRGTRDFGPAEMQKRNYIFSVIKKNFELFGYQPLETPAMENSETLLGKYGEEGDKLIYRVIDSGNPLEDKVSPLTREMLEKIYGGINLVEPKKPDGKSNQEEYISWNYISGATGFTTAQLSSKTISNIVEKALRYDLTVPFARYVVMNQHNITFPFKRYQIQPVWRADKPQKGRYREFYQCDADIIGSDSLVNELDLISLIDISFSQLKVPVILKINNRKILAGIAENVGAPDRMVDIAIAIDKLDKIGADGVKKELQENDFTEKQINYLFDAILSHSLGDNSEIASISKLNYLIQNTELGKNETFKKGCEELEYLFRNCKVSHIKIELDITLARGLDYYTGTIFEVKANAGTFTPSILGGGRYDDLTGIFGLPNMSGVGISFGIDRIYDVMEELNLYPESVSKVSSTKLLFAHFDESNRDHCMQLASELRKNLVSCEVYPDVTKKVAKQFDYANKKSIPFVCVVGSNEMEKKRYNLKNMVSGTQEELSLDEIINKLK